MDAHYDTGHVAAPDRARHWEAAVGQTYFSLQLQFQDAARFEGSLHSWHLGALSLSRLASSPLCYRRLKAHLRDSTDEQYLITVPRRSGIRFAQDGRETRCEPGAFLLEHGQSPYEFSYGADNALWVLKVPGALLAGRLRTPDRYCALSFDATGGAGWLFASYVELVGRQLAQRRDGADGATRELAAQQLVDLLVCSVQGDARVLASRDSAVRAAHLCRIEDYARRHLCDRDLTPDRVAQACGISVRYLHALYRDVGQTFGQWLQGQRLERADQALRASARPPASVAAIAHAWGFADQSHFTRLFKRRYGRTPGQARRAAD
ncbi:AraC family transcriptional regulator [Bordetella genomosp. 1]|uniref:AraC family transcriptional regulator n=1 Tax=Bordetella genomosp. 1 TaxID=1395607 RepID=A0A261SD81_9BORD|nr:helix-turn-helix domain-containing protein [Bordetella genomosp. 1]OZI35364.1 AraC family transcriptional regulator [Bordetella genomosp. 1]